MTTPDPTPAGDTYTLDEGAQILAEVKAHLKRELIETVAEATFALANEHGSGGGMWWHLSQAYVLVEALPALCLDEDSLCDEPGCGAHRPTTTDPTPAPWVAFDTEFIEDGRTIDLLSIGMVRADGATYYAEPAETDRSRASAWVAENVLPHLTGPIKPREQIAAEVVQFAGERPEFWAYFADYDWVALCQLYGTMMDLPSGWPYYCRDLKQALDARGLDIRQDDSIHNALDDARWVADRLREELEVPDVE
jgi:hypothetical protein